MWVFVWGVREEGPVVLNALAWSHGASRDGGGYGRRGRYQEPEDDDSEKEEPKPEFYSWTTAQVVQWARTNGVAESVLKALEAHAVDGRALFATSYDDLKGTRVP